MLRSRTLGILLLLGCSIGDIPLAAAHGFGARYDLPVPLWLYAVAAGATVALSFVVIALWIHRHPGRRPSPRLNLLRWRVGRALVSPMALRGYRLSAVMLFILVVLIGLLGTQQPSANLVPLLVWVYWWVGLAYVTALVGNVWAFINPWRTLFAGFEVWYRRRWQRQLSRHLPYPRRLGVWPGVALFVAFAWIEHVFSGQAVPAYLAILALEYAVITWLGMYLFGKDIWLHHGEVFTIIFGLFGRFAATEVRVIESQVCATCPLDCRDAKGQCLNCMVCFERANPEARQWNLRPFAVGLLYESQVSTSLLTCILLLLATVTFDGFTATPAWWRLTQWLYFHVIPEVGIDHLALTDTCSLGLFVGIFCSLYIGCCWSMARLTRHTIATATLARHFALSLLPIALAYHLAHYFSFALIQGQTLVPRLSDPFGYGWNLFGTAAYEINLTIISNRLVWFLAVGAIVGGHIIAVYVAHVRAWRLFRNPQLAWRSQYPLLLLMIGYTMVSLWILAQPIVNNPPPGG